MSMLMVALLAARSGKPTAILCERINPITKIRPVARPQESKFSRSRQLRYRCCYSLLCSAPLLMVYNLTPRYHGCSNSSTLDHSTSMETSQRHFMIVPGAFLGNVFDQKTRPTWERKSARVDRMWLFCVG